MNGGLEVREISASSGGLGRKVLVGSLFGGTSPSSPDTASRRSLRPKSEG